MGMCMTCMSHFYIMHIASMHLVLDDIVAYTHPQLVVYIEQNRDTVLYTD